MPAEQARCAARTWAMVMHIVSSAADASALKIQLRHTCSPRTPTAGGLSSCLQASTRCSMQPPPALQAGAMGVAAAACQSTDEYSVRALVAIESTYDHPAESGNRRTVRGVAYGVYSQGYLCCKHHVSDLDVSPCTPPGMQHASPRHVRCAAMPGHCISRQQGASPRGAPA
jgi:hypothetical protein